MLENRNIDRRTAIKQVMFGVGAGVVALSGMHSTEARAAGVSGEPATLEVAGATNLKELSILWQPRPGAANSKPSR